MCDEYDISYVDSFQVHADRNTSWKQYQPGVETSKYEVRVQSRHPDTVLVCARAIASQWRLGCHKPPKLNRQERFQYHAMKARGGEEARLAERIVIGVRITQRKGQFSTENVLIDKSKSGAKEACEEWGGKSGGG